MNNWAIISSKTRVYQALALLDSIRKYGDTSDIHLLATDHEAFDVLSFFAKKSANTYVYHEEEVVPKELVGLKENRRYFAYCWTLKSIFCDYLIKNIEANDTISYVDSDILFFGDVTNYLSRKEYSTFFTCEEHYFPNMDEAKVENIKGIVGNFNSGFISFRNDSEGCRALTWWMQRCIESCDVNSEVFGDQKYLNDIPALFRHVVTEASIQINVGPWNILKRKVTTGGESVFFGDYSLLFYHFVGFRLKNPTTISLMENIPSSASSFFDDNPSGLIVYELYKSVLADKIAEIVKKFPDFNGYTDQDADDWATYQLENDVLGLN